MARLSKIDKARLEEYKKVDYNRRAVLLERWGYASQQAFFDAVGYKPKRTPRIPDDAPAIIRGKRRGRPRKTAGTVAGETKEARTTAKVKDAPITKRGPGRPKKVKAEKAEPVDMVIAFDVTGSMSSYHNSVKTHAKEVISNLFKSNPNLKMKVVAFGDYCDMKGKNDFGNAYQSIELTNDENKLIEFVDNVRQTSGGDSAEFYELVIKKINEETEWRAAAKKAVLLIADDRPHGLGYSYSPIVIKNKIDWKKEAKNAAKKGIAYDTLKINPRIQWYEELSKITNGVSLDFHSSNKTADLVKASTLSRSSSKGFKSAMASAVASGDEEMIGVYTSYSKVAGTLDD